MTDPVISVTDARARHGQDGVVFLDGSWTFPGGPQAGAEGFIPGARVFDIDTVKDASSDLPHMLPTPAEFETHARALGLSDTDSLIVYDRFGLFSAARVWWMFRAMGHDNVRVLSGGLPLWIREGGPVDDMPAGTWPDGRFTARFDPQRVVDRSGVMAALEDPAQLILDARPRARFAGHAREPRDGMRAGHMPGARNLPFPALLDTNGRLVADARTFHDAGLADQSTVITTCGSGVTACILALGLERLGRTARVYDGSWVEWGARADTPIVTDED